MGPAARIVGITKSLPAARAAVALDVLKKRIPRNRREALGTPCYCDLQRFIVATHTVRRRGQRMLVSDVMFEMLCQRMNE